MFALCRQGKAILDTAGTLEDVVVVGRRVALAYDVGAAELEGLGERGGAAPLDVLGAVGGALVVAAHDVDVIEVADFGVRETAQLGDGGDAAVLRHGAVAPEGE